MKNKIFLPKKIRVGFQDRKSTYTGKLAYITYFDELNILRKETSWNCWRDQDIEPITYENNPIEGFVINKKVGGYSSGWNHRQAYCRIYDPRGFEFEINIENLLYILENTNSIKGKGLEGKFIYGWNGKDLILIPISSPDYKDIKEYSNILNSKKYIKSNDLILGAIYKTRNNIEYIYMGRYDYWRYVTKWNNSHNNYTEIITNAGKYYYFVENNLEKFNIKTIKTINSQLIHCSYNKCVDNFAELFEKLEYNVSFSPYDDTKDKYIDYTFEEFINKLSNNNRFYIYGDDYKKYIIIPPNYNKVFGKKVSVNKEDYLQFLNMNEYNRQPSYNKIYYKETISKFYNSYKPKYKLLFLKNGKLYRNGLEYEI